MNLEFNLVKTPDFTSPVVTLLARERKQVEGEDAVLEAICSFIRDNAPTFDAALTDKSLVSKLQTLESMTVTEFMSLKFILTQSGIDLLVNAVAEQEINESDIPDGMNEYNLIDDMDVEYGFIRFTTKMQVPESTEDMHEIYSKIVDMFDFFKSGPASDSENPLRTNLDILRMTQETLGINPSGITQYLNSVFDYLGKRIILISND